MSEIKYLDPEQANSIPGIKQQFRFVKKALEDGQTIPDIDEIRENANKGATAYQKPSAGIPASDLNSTVRTALAKAEGAVSVPGEPGTVGQVLQLDAQGNPAWVTPSAGTTPDSEMSKSSTNAVQNKVITEELLLGTVYDVSAKNPTAGPNNDGKWGTLSALLSDTNLNTLIPTAVRKGGMSVKYVQSSDNKYVEYFLPKNTWSALEDDWQKLNLEEEVNQLDQEIYGGVSSIKNNTYIISKLAGYYNSSFGFVENGDWLSYKVDISSFIGEKINVACATKGGWCGIELLDGTSSSDLKWTQDGETAERVIPENAKYLYISDKPSFVSVDDVIINVITKGVVEKLSDIEDNIGNLSNLQTENKTNIVAAINEIAASDKISFIGKKWVVIGDSRSAWMYNETNVYYSWIANEMGLIKDSANKQFKDSNGNAFIDYNGAAGSYLIKWIYNNEGPNPSLLDRVLISDPDVVTIYMGVNDYAFAYDSLGTMADSENTLSFYGNLKKVILSVYAKFPNAQIVYLTPQRFKGYTSFAAAEEQNANGNTIDEYAQAVKDVCGYYSVPVIDVLHDGDYTPLITSQNTKYFIDGLHENPDGHKQIAKLLLTKLNTLFAL